MFKHKIQDFAVHLFDLPTDLYIFPLYFIKKKLRFCEGEKNLQYSLKSSVFQNNNYYNIYSILKFPFVQSTLNTPSPKWDFTNS